MATATSASVRMRLLLLLVIAMLALAACGGGDDDDDDGGDASPAVTRTTASSTGSAVGGTAAVGSDNQTPTTAAAAPTNTEPAASPTPSATATTPATPTEASTPTRVPATVAATPRLVATRAPDVVQAPPTPTPEPGTQWIIDESFDDGTTQHFFLGEFESGAVGQIDQGWYGLTVGDQAWQVTYADQAGRHNNGVLGADVSIVGNGDAGLVARVRIDDDGGYSFLLCSVYSTGAAGCWVNNSGEWTEIGYVPDGTIPQADTYRMIMVTYVAQVLFTVNDVEVGLFEVDMPEEGYVGMFSSSTSGDVTVWFDYFLFGIGTTAE